MYLNDFPEPTTARLNINAAYRRDEDESVAWLLAQSPVDGAMSEAIRRSAATLVERVRAETRGHGGLDSFLQQYELSSQEGLVLMCLAEALLRIPDAETANHLIRDKLTTADWSKYVGASDSLFVNASTWALMMTGKVISVDPADPGRVVRKLVKRSGEPVIRQAMVQAMRIMGRQFVMGRNLGEALQRARDNEAAGYTYSYDMLGEAAHTMADADRYFAAYLDAIRQLGDVTAGRGVVASPGISIKLSALHPRYEFGQYRRVLGELIPRVLELAQAAAEANVSLCIDAEEADRLDLSLDVFERVFCDRSLKQWDGLGLAVQAYLKRAPLVLDWLRELSGKVGRRIMVRLVKGAYWDAEIKRAQELGLDGYPVYTRKSTTDTAYLVCAARLLADRKAFYPQFATHNAHTLAAVIEIAGDHSGYEFQRLHGMGEALYAQVVGGEHGVGCRVYAPVGSHEDLLAYLVRRLLENGANTSFVNRIVDEALPVDEIVSDPVVRTRALASAPHPQIPLPSALFGSERRNSAGMDLSDPAALGELDHRMEMALAAPIDVAPLIAGERTEGRGHPVTDPADRRRIVGSVVDADDDAIEIALATARSATYAWDRTPASTRADLLEHVADLYEEHHAELMALCIREAGKSVQDALAEVREAVDFCRYYAACARRDFEGPSVLPGPTGEHNTLTLHGCGVFLCISPWNFPLAIFTGQVVAALAAGNTVIAKPAEQTVLVAARAIALMHAAGIPGDVVQLLPGQGRSIGPKLVNDTRISGVAFTGSTETARLINRQLAERPGPIVPLIAETGGQNAMLVDSSALPEQVVTDVIASAFQSAGQRCSALRVLFVQTDIADRVIEMLIGAMRELRIGDPGLLSTDVGPVIDADARAMLERHAARMTREGRLLYRCDLPPETANGTFFAPHAFEIDALDRLEREVFGPILHVIRYRASDLDAVIDAINDTGYGLTLGIHSRIDLRVRHIHDRLRVGNTYVNRNQIGAVVGVQPFGGHGLSGTGPKAGGPHYLHRFARESALSINTTAAGGNTSLVSLLEDDI